MSVFNRMKSFLFSDDAADAPAPRRAAGAPHLRVVAGAAKNGIPTPAFSSSLAYYDGIRADRLPAALVQGQRDFFGAHTYHRVDAAGSFHTVWGGDRSEIQVGAPFIREVVEPKEAEKVDSPPQ